MTYQPFYIAGFEEDSGLNTYFEPFLIPEKAFPNLEDAYCWRGRIKRRIGYTLLGRLRRGITQEALAATTGAGTYTVADLLAGVRATEPNAEIQTSTVSITIARGGGDQTTYTDNGSGVLTMSVGGTYTISAGTVNYITGAVSLTFTVVPAVGKTVDATFFYFPALPVMGLPTKETPNVDFETLYAFDTKYAYQFTSGSFSELPAAVATTWQGNNSDFFWSINYFQNANGQLFWTTNFNKGANPDPIRYYDTTAWTTFNPAITGATFLEQCRILIPYKNRLLAFNTWEGANLAAATNYPQRLRYSQNGDPTDLVNGWREDIVGFGGHLDAPTDEQIVSVEFIKDTLIVKFERSSWKIIYTGNEVLPFVFQKINTELGAESTFSLVPFDRGVFAVGNYGITTDDSINVFRIDQQIPQFVFNFNTNNNGIKRIHGVRDYVNELVYWTFVDDTLASSGIYPSKMLVYNYINNTYAIFNDSFTCFGYFQRVGNFTWATIPYPSWAAWTATWNSGIGQQAFPDVVAGNQQGFVEILNQQIYNDVSLAITTITPAVSPAPVTLKVPSHNLITGQFVEISGIIGSGSPNPSTLNGIIGKVTRVDADNITVSQLVGGIFVPVTLAAGGTYLANGKITVLNNFNITTKVFSPFYDVAASCRLGYVDFFLERTDDGEIVSNVYINENDSFSINDSDAASNDGLLGSNIVLTRQESADIPFQATQSKIWHRMYVQAVCENFQLVLSFSDAQMVDKTINSSNIVLHALALYISKNSRLIE